ncbi:MAG: hypothetical protein NC831_05410 [Candidatus Omnitrophica bacterium]|nr:hypothetical protein [Candidatus Omnitrophota bacterium]MCM8828477.1 hypothetical protein [Candidatus Omnitrophota bacterium]
MMEKIIYTETFDDGPGGWLGWDKNGAFRLEIKDSSIISESPWWIDCNHCFPGAGFLHILFALHTSHKNINPEPLIRVADRNRFVDGNFPTDFTGAKITLKIKGEVDLKGSNLYLLVQGNTGKIWVNQIFTGYPIKITKDWSIQSFTLIPDQKFWTQLGSREDRKNTYGEGPIEKLLANVNGDIIFVLFPLNVAPVDKNVDPYKGWAERDYEVDREKLPSGYVMLDEAEIEFNRGIYDTEKKG